MRFVIFSSEYSAVSLFKLLNIKTHKIEISSNFDILLTVHLSIFISLFNQLDVQNLFHNRFYFMPLHVSSTCAHHQEVKIALLVHETATYTCDWYRRLCNVIWPPDDEHMCSKHVEAWNKTYCETNFVHLVS